MVIYLADDILEFIENENKISKKSLLRFLEENYKELTDEEVELIAQHRKKLNKETKLQEEAKKQKTTNKIFRNAKIT